MLALAIGLARLGGPPRRLGRTHPARAACTADSATTTSDLAAAVRALACRTTASVRARSSFRSGASISARTSPRRTDEPMLTASRAIRPETAGSDLDPLRRARPSPAGRSCGGTPIPGPRPRLQLRGDPGPDAVT